VLADWLHSSLSSGIDTIKIAFRLYYNNNSTDRSFYVLEDGSAIINHADISGSIKAKSLMANALTLQDEEGRTLLEGGKITASQVVAQNLCVQDESSSTQIFSAKVSGEIKSTEKIKVTASTAPNIATAQYFIEYEGEDSSPDQLTVTFTRKDYSKTVTIQKGTRATLSEWPILMFLEKNYTLSVSGRESQTGTLVSDPGSYDSTANITYWNGSTHVYKTTVVKSGKRSVVFSAPSLMVKDNAEIENLYGLTGWIGYKTTDGESNEYILFVNGMAVKCTTTKPTLSDGNFGYKKWVTGGDLS
jgi:hypothetical protein